jgi:hypothetical protein
MSTSSHGPGKSITLEQVEDWIDTTRRKRLELHLLATEPWTVLDAMMPLCPCRSC